MLNKFLAVLIAACIAGSTIAGLNLSGSLVLGVAILVSVLIFVYLRVREPIETRQRRKHLQNLALKKVLQAIALANSELNDNNRSTERVRSEKADADLKRRLIEALKR